MNRTLVDRIADAVLYEGYILYPYRPSVKNRHRWNFGGLYPEAYCREQRGADACENQTECLVEGGPEAPVQATARFLHLTARQVGACDPPLAAWPADAEPAFRTVETLQVGERYFQTWQEAEERAISVRPLSLAALAAEPYREDFTVPGRRWLEPLRDDSGAIHGVLVREQQALVGSVTLSAEPVAEGLFRLTVRVRNNAALGATDLPARDAALAHSLLSTHLVLRVDHGGFVSLLDPPPAWSDLAAGCRNVGVWPVLVGEAGQRDTMLASPIILYDYPQVAPESPGDLFDGTEIDEILSLRILTLTDDEKRQAADVDERARQLLARTEALDPNQLLRLHGAIRRPRAVAEGGTRG